MTDIAPKLDAGKPRLDLIAPHFLVAVGRVMAFGAKKYESWSWTKGKPWSKDYAAVLRHVTSWAGGEDVDPESGEPHLAHAACDIMFLLVSQAYGLGTDDRKKFVPPAPAKDKVGYPCEEPDCDFCGVAAKTKELR